MVESLTPDALRRALETHGRVEVPALPGRTNHIRAGVLVPIDLSDAPQVILTERAAKLRQHAGEACFPGGRPEDGDKDLEATALREAEEEIGLRGATILGRLSSIPVYTSEHRLEPFVAIVPDVALSPNPDEVARLLRLPVLETLRAPSIEGIPWEEGHMRHTAPIFRVDGKVVFGATAYVLLELLGVLAGVLGLPLPELRPGSLTWADVLGR